MRKANLRLPAILWLVIAVTGCQDLSPLTRSAASSATPVTPHSAPTVSGATREPAANVGEYAVPSGAGPHDVAVARNGDIWYTAQRTGELGRLEPATGKIHQVKLGNGSAPHGVIVGPDGAPWVTDGGLNAIVRVDPLVETVQVFPLPETGAHANLNTATFDHNGTLWFTGQAGVYGRLNSKEQIEVWRSPNGPGPYGIATTPEGNVYFASLAGSYLGRIDLVTGTATILQPPTRQQGARRVWSDSHNRLWISEWNIGQVGMFDPATGKWREWRLPGESPQPYAIYVDERDQVWLSDFGSNAIVNFDPSEASFRSFPLPTAGAYVRQLAGRPGEVWGAESGADKLVVIRTR